MPINSASALLDMIRRLKADAQFSPADGTTDDDAPDSIGHLATCNDTNFAFWSASRSATIFCSSPMRMRRPCRGIARHPIPKMPTVRGMDSIHPGSS